MEANKKFFLKLLEPGAELRAWRLFSWGGGFTHLEEAGDFGNFPTVGKKGSNEVVSEKNGRQKNHSAVLVSNKLFLKDQNTHGSILRIFKQKPKIFDLCL